MLLTMETYSTWFSRGSGSRPIVSESANDNTVTPLAVSLKLATLGLEDVISITIISPVCFFNSCHAGCHFCRLLITIANSFDPD